MLLVLFVLLPPDRSNLKLLAANLLRGGDTGTVGSKFSSRWHTEVSTLPNPRPVTLNPKPKIPNPKPGPKPLNLQLPGQLRGPPSGWPRPLQLWFWMQGLGGLGSYGKIRDFWGTGFETALLLPTMPDSESHISFVRYVATTTKVLYLKLFSAFTSRVRVCGGKLNTCRAGRRMVTMVLLGRTLKRCRKERTLVARKAVPCSAR